MPKIKEYLSCSKYQTCDYTLLGIYMWADYFGYQIAEDDRALFLRSTKINEGYFLPLLKEYSQEKMQSAIAKILKTEEKNTSVTFICVPEPQKGVFDNFKICDINKDTDWSDYTYPAENLSFLRGKKLGKKRNLIHQFLDLYPDYEYQAVDKDNLKEVVRFSKDFSFGVQNSRLAVYEQEQTDKVLEDYFSFDVCGRVLKVNKKIVGIAVGEKIDRTLFIHIEKANKEIKGVYQMLDMLFCKEFFERGDIDTINREEDVGDEGLRKAKNSYYPQMLYKYKVVIENSVYNNSREKTIFDRILSPVSLKSQRLVISDIEERDKENYAIIYLDDELNKYWGYDYREDLKGQAPTPEYFFNFQQHLKDVKEEYSVAVRYDGQMIGELVLHNFDEDGGVEMGFRFIKDYQGKGFALESASVLKEYVFNGIKATKLKSRCNKLNLSSRRLIERLGLNKCREDESHYYFELLNKKQGERV